MQLVSRPDRAAPLRQSEFVWRIEGAGTASLRSSPKSAYGYINQFRHQSRHRRPGTEGDRQGSFNCVVLTSMPSQVVQRREISRSEPGQSSGSTSPQRVVEPMTQPQCIPPPAMGARPSWPVVASGVRVDFQVRPELARRRRRLRRVESSTLDPAAAPRIPISTALQRHRELRTLKLSLYQSVMKSPHSIADGQRVNDSVMTAPLGTGFDDSSRQRELIKRRTSFALVPEERSGRA